MKKRAYEARIWEVEQNSFAPLVFLLLKEWARKLIIGRLTACSDDNNSTYVAFHQFKCKNFYYVYELCKA